MDEFVKKQVTCIACGNTSIQSVLLNDDSMLSYEECPFCHYVSKNLGCITKAEVEAMHTDEYVVTAMLADTEARRKFLLDILNKHNENE